MLRRRLQQLQHLENTALELKLVTLFLSPSMIKYLAIGVIVLTDINTLAHEAVDVSIEAR